MFSSLGTGISRAAALTAAVILVAVVFSDVAEAVASYPPIPADKTTPIHQRLSLKGPTTLSIGWNTYEKIAKPCVSYGTSPSSLSESACSSSSVTYPTSRTWSNYVQITGLKPATTYYYRIQSTNSTTGQFMASRAAGDKTPFTMSVVIDLGVYGKDGYTAKTDAQKRDIPKVDPSLNHATIGTLARMADSYEFVVHPGDLAYADDWILHPTNLLSSKDAYQSILEQFYTQLAPISGRKPYMVSPGNHEATCVEAGGGKGCPEGQRNFTDFMNRFGSIMPTAFDLPNKDNKAAQLREKAKGLALAPFWFSFDYGMAHIVLFDTETDYPDAEDQPGGDSDLGAGPFGKAGQQAAFLEADLASVDRTVTPWIVVAGHRPWYTTSSSSDQGNGSCTPCQNAFEGIFYKYGVDLAIFGHVHNAQRFPPMYQNKIDPAGLKNPKAPMYIVAGGAGNIEGLSAADRKPNGTVFAYADDFSFATVSFKSASELGVTFYKSADGSVLDQSTLVKDHKTPFVIQS